MKTKLRSLLIIPVVFLILFTTGCASTWYGCVAVLQIAYGVTTAVTDHEERDDCKIYDPGWETPDPPVEVILPPCPDSNYDSGTAWNNPDHNAKPAIDTHRESKSNQSDPSPRPFTRR